VHKESHETLLGLGELVATIAEELLRLLVEQRAVDRLVRLVLQAQKKIIMKHKTESNVSDPSISRMDQK
jgi:hypothetical protein